MQFDKRKLRFLLLTNGQTTSEMILMLMVDMIAVM